MEHTRFKFILFDDLTSVALAVVDDNRTGLLLRKTVLDTSIRVISSLHEHQLVVIKKLDDEPNLFEKHNFGIYLLNTATFKEVADSEYLANKKTAVKLKLDLIQFMIDNIDYMMNTGNFLLTADMYHILQPSEQNVLNIEIYAKNRKISTQEAEKELSITLESRNFRLASIQGVFDYCIDKLQQSNSAQSILAVREEFKSLFTLDLERLPVEGGKVR